ncbi:Histidinol-phosphate aminotransferase 2 [Legionella micdadei]|uniref:Histidinol-phosphate aminotransferase n=1 Tax=Legionella micdadei TaxID=451 RepID=A0A098GGK2_LEGMI|nr:histidinol-phosphate aminotransferase [Legionella micdadei]CEG61593.1 Histidinol-phosphate aminotransferase 2 [Legionella micdadei]SCY46715.1 histidinol-phosphate aminotransferase [Legionella micdadei]
MPFTEHSLLARCWVKMDVVPPTKIKENLLPCDYHQLPHPGIQSLHPYIPGKSVEEVAREQGLTDIIKLASNENPFGCSPQVQKALAKLSAIQIASYPSPANHPLSQKLSERLAITQDMLMLGNGTDSLFLFLLVTFALHTGKHILTHEYAFISYQIQAQTLGIPVSKIALKANWQVDIDAMISACNEQTALIFLANPNNPTGQLTPLEEIERLIASIPTSTILVLDEAYYEYVYGQVSGKSINLLAQYPNLVITRTFSKVYGLAGLRLGYFIANPQITELVQRVQPPFMVNQAALAAAHAALDDDDFIHRSLEANIRGKQQLIQGFEALKINYLPSRCNFVTIDCQTETKSIYQDLLKYGIIVRPLNQYGLPNHLRISIGTNQQNELLLDKLSICLSRIKK